MKLKAHFILIFLVVFLSNKLVGQVVNGELKPCPGVAYTYIFSGPTFTNYFQWYATDGTIISQNSNTVVVIWNNEINDGGRWNLRVHYEAMGSGGTSGGSTYKDLKVKPKVTSPYNISGSTEIPGDFVGTKTYTAGPVHSTYPATSFVWSTNTGIQVTTTSPSVTLDMSDKQLQWIGVQGKIAECASLGQMSKLNIYFSSVINGPSTICTDGIYTIANPGTITLENAAGIATLTALGNNQWKVSRIGTGYGTVTLKSTNGSNIKTFPIKIGMLTNSRINGPDLLYANYQLNEPIFSITLAPNETFTINQFIVDRAQVELYDRDDSNLTFKLRIPANWNFISNPTSDYFNITVKGVTSNGCQVFFTKEVMVYPNPNSGGGGMEPPGS